MYFVSSSSLKIKNKKLQVFHCKFYDSISLVCIFWGFVPEITMTPTLDFAPYLAKKLPVTIISLKNGLWNVPIH